MSVKSVTEADFKPNVQASGVTLVDFWAQWCPPCKVLSPMLDELGEEWGDAVSVLKVDVDDSPSAAAEYGIMSMPTVIVFKDGQPVEKLVGLRPKEVYRSIVARYAQ